MEKIKEKKMIVLNEPSGFTWEDDVEYYYVLRFVILTGGSIPYPAEYLDTV